jgi:hypothetical protein
MESIYSLGMQQQQHSVPQQMARQPDLPSPSLPMHTQQNFGGRQGIPSITNPNQTIYARQAEKDVHQHAIVGSNALAGNPGSYEAKLAEKDMKQKIFAEELKR